jgi:Arc/MetJ family transcription regulator
MRVNADIDDELMMEAMELTGFKTRQEVIDVALCALVASRKRQALPTVAGKRNENRQARAIGESERDDRPGVS